MRKINSLLILLSLFFINACSTHSDAVYHTGFNFSKVETYSIYQRNSAFTDTQSMSDSKRNSIEIAIEKALEHQGFQYQDTGKADIVITYHLLKGKRNDYRDYNKEVLFCHRCLKANNWHNEGNSLQIQKGSLIIDIIDPERKRSVWRSVAPIDIDVEDNSRTMNDKIQQEIMLMFKQYPHASQGKN